MNNFLFSPAVKDIIKESREVAIAFGYGYISTLHFFVADCRLNNKGSIKQFAFPKEDNFHTFCESIRTNQLDLDKLEESLPLTLEAENIIRNTEKERKKYSQSFIHPWHLFLSAASVKDSQFSLCFPKENNLYEKLVEYYNEKKLLAPDELPAKNITFFQKIFFRSR